MALVFNGSSLDEIRAALLPAGYNKPVIAQFDDHENKYLGIEFSVAKSTVENANQNTTVDDLLTALNVLINAMLTADKNAAAATTAYAIIKSLTTNMNKDGVIWSNGVTNYVILVDIFAKTA